MDKPAKTFFLFLYCFMILTMLLSVISIAGCTNKITESDLPKYSGFINDYTGKIDKSQIEKTEQFVRTVGAKTSSEIAVAVINSLDGVPIEKYAVALFEKWGIGKKEKNNGVLLLVVLNDRELRIEVGYGLEGTITDLESKVIIDNIITPRFKAGNYASGIYNGTVAIANEIYKENGNAVLEYSDNIVSEQTSSSNSGSKDKMITVIAVSYTHLTLPTILRV